MRKIVWKETRYSDDGEPQSVKAKVGFVKLCCVNYRRYPVYANDVITSVNNGIIWNKTYHWASLVTMGDLYSIRRVGKTYKTIEECKEATICLAREFLLDFHCSIDEVMKCFDDVTDVVGSTNVRILGKTCKHDPSFISAV